MATMRPVQWYTEDPTALDPGLELGSDPLGRPRLLRKSVMETLGLARPETAAATAPATPLPAPSAPSASAAPTRALPLSARATDPSLRPHTAGPIGPNETNVGGSTQAPLQGSVSGPPTQSEAGEGLYARQRRELTQQLNNLQDYQPDYSAQRAYMQNRSQQGVEALGAAILAGVGPSFTKTLQPGFAKQYHESTQPLPVEGGYITPGGQEMLDPGYQHQKKIEFLSKRLDALNALEQKALNDQDRRAVDRERQSLQAAIAQLTYTVGMDRNQAMRDAAAMRNSQQNQDHPTGQVVSLDANGNPVYLTKQGNIGQWVNGQFTLLGQHGMGGGQGGPGPGMPGAQPGMPGAQPGMPQGQGFGGQQLFNKTPLAANEKTVLEKGGAAYQELNRLIGGHHAGMGAGSFQGIPGAAEAMTYWGNKSPWASDDARERAGWWSQYAEMTNRIRHELFGSAVTRQELIAFNAQMPLPGDHPDQVARKLATQRAIAAQAIVKLHQAYSNRFESRMLPPLAEVQGFATPPDPNEPFRAQPAPSVLEKSKKAGVYQRYGVQ